MLVGGLTNYGINAACYAALGAAIGWVQWIRRLPAAGYCLSCAYNLTGNKSGVCLECGTLPPKRGDTA